MDNNAVLLLYVVTWLLIEEDVGLFKLLSFATFSSFLYSSLRFFSMELQRAGKCNKVL